MSGPAAAKIFRFEGFRFDAACGSLIRENGATGGEPILLGSRAAAVLALLVERAGELVTKDEIFAAVWPATIVEEANLSVQVSALRRVLDRDREKGSCIQTVPGRGYRFAAPVSLAEAFTPCSNGTAGPASDYPETRSFEASGLKPIIDTRHRPRRAVIAAIAVILCFVAAVIAIMTWHSPAPGGHVSKSPPSIIVLPFQDLSGDLEGKRLADAVADDVTTDLSRIWDLIVISRDIASSYRGQPVNARQIGRELKVRYVLQGNIQRSEDRVQVNVQLVDAETGAQLAADRFRTDAADAMEAQNEITGRIARTLFYKVAHSERLRIERETPGDLTARDLVMLGWDKLNRPNMKPSEVQRLFERALELDPQSVNARLGLAKLLLDQVAYPRTEASQRTEARIEQLLSEALSIGTNQTQTYATTGYFRMLQNRLVESSD